MGIEHSTSKVYAAGNAADAPSERKGLWLIVLLALVGIFGYLMKTTAWFTMVPGDLGDARFNSVILEHIYQWLQGKSHSLWSPEFFYPYPDALAFSDNHFGTAWIYALARFSGLSRELAFDAWFCLGALSSYFCCAYAARKFGFGWMASAIAAFIFAFSPPILQQELHAQLIYRYAIPLAALNLWQVIELRRFDRLAWLAIWIAVQFFCSIYLGLFLAMLIGAITIASFYVQSKTLSAAPTLPIQRAPRRTWRVASIYLAALLWIALLLMLGKYHAVAKEYGFQRSVGEIETMLPHLGSYLIADSSLTDAWIGSWITNIPMRHEHQMFFGLTASILAIIGAATGRHSPKWSRPARIFALALLALVVVTLSVGRFSLYRLIMVLPGFNSIRAVTRTCLVMLLPVAWLAAIGFETLNTRMPKWRMPLALSITVLLAIELVSFRPFHVPITNWEERLQGLTVGSNPLEVTKDPILFVRHSPNDSLPSIFTELDAMMLAQNLGIPTANGYSGNLPAYFGLADSCMIAASRLANAAPYTHLTPSDVSGMLRRLFILPSNESCPDFSSLHPYQGPLSDDVFRNISIAVLDQVPEGPDYIVTLEISNHTQSYLPALSTSDEPVQLSWQLIQQGGSVSTSAWTTRVPLAADVPPGSTYRQQVRIAPPPSAHGRYVIAFSLVQDGVAWFHDKGMNIAIGHIPIEAQNH